MSSRFKRTGGNVVKNTSGVGPAHLNKVAFRPPKNSTVTMKVNALGNGDVCKRCHDILEWRKNFRKFKLLKRPKKCSMCSQASVKCLYHILCQRCSRDNSCCAKCKKPAGANESFHVYIPPSLCKPPCLHSCSLVCRQEPEDPEMLLRMLKATKLMERERRSLLRELEMGTLTADKIAAVSVSN